MEQEVTELTINGTKYIKADSFVSVPKPGKRAVVVVDRGWIFAGAGDDTSKPGKLILTRAVHVFSWAGQGFAAMVANPLVKTDLRPCADVEVPVDSEIFRVPVSDNWGIK